MSNQPTVLPVPENASVFRNGEGLFVFMKNPHPRCYVDKYRLLYSPDGVLYDDLIAGSTHDIGRSENPIAQLVHNGVELHRKRLDEFGLQIEGSLIVDHTSVALKFKERVFLASSDRPSMVHCRKLAVGREFVYELRERFEDPQYLVLLMCGHKRARYQLWLHRNDNMKQLPLDRTTGLTPDRTKLIVPTGKHVLTIHSDGSAEWNSIRTNECFALKQVDHSQFRLHDGPGEMRLDLLSATAMAL